MQIDSEALDANLTAICLTGRLDSAGVQEIEAQFAQMAASTLAVMVDLSAVDYMASSGISMMIAAARARTRRGGKLVLCRCQPRVRQVLATAGIDGIIPIFDQRDDARAELAEIDRSS